MQTYAVEGERPPKCRAPGIIVLVIGILQFIAMIGFIIMAAVGKDSSAGIGWWQNAISSAVLIVTGALAVASADGKRNCHVPGIVFSSITLAWCLVSLVIFSFALSALIHSIRGSSEGDAQGTTVSVTVYVTIIISLLVILLLIACDIAIMVLISKVTCCSRSGHLMGVVVLDGPPDKQNYTQAKTI